MSQSDNSDISVIKTRKIPWYRKHLPVVALSVAIIVVSATLLHHMMSSNASNLTVEIMAAVVAVVLVVASVAVTLHFQSDYEVERDCKTEIFKKRLEIYEHILEMYSELDDEDNINEDKLNKIQNLALRASLVATTDVTASMANYTRNIWLERKLYFSDQEVKDLQDKFGDDPQRRMYPGSFRSLVKEMREDLNLIEEEDKKKFLEESIKILVNIEKKSQPKHTVARPGQQEELRSA